MIDNYNKIAILNKKTKLNMQDNGNFLENYTIDFGNINFIPKMFFIKFNAHSNIYENVCMGWVTSDELKREWDDVLLQYPERGIGGEASITFRSKTSKSLKLDISFSSGIRMDDLILDKIILIE